MKLKYIAISDIGPFRGRHEFDFSGSEGKTGFAIFSKNGRGKTSLFNAMQWCLFGVVYERGSVRGGKWAEGKARVVVGDYSKDKPLMNQDAYQEDKIPEMGVFIIANDGDKDVQISRSAKSRVGSMPRHDEGLSFQLQVTVGKKSASEKLGQELIEEMFPNELRRFFFIDGESLEEYVDLVKAGQVGGIKDDVEAVLRIPALTRGIFDLEKVMDEVWSEVDSETKTMRKKIKSANEAGDILKDIKNMKEELRGKESSYNKTNSKFERLEEELKGLEESASHIQNLEKLRLKKEGLETTLKRSSDSKKSYASNAWKALLWSKAGVLHDEANSLMGEIQNRDYKISSTEKRLRKMEEELSSWSGVCSHCEQPIDDAEKHKRGIEGKIADTEEALSVLRGGSDMSLNEASSKLGDLAKLSPPNGTRKMIADSNRNWAEDKASLDNVREELEKEEGRGLEGVDSEELYKKFELRGTMRTSLVRMRPSIDELQQEIRRSEIEYKKLGGEEVKSRDPKKAKLKETIGILLNVMKDTLAEYRDDARKEVEKIASESFVNIINAPEALRGIIIDKNFNGSIKGADGKAITMPSSGQEMTMTLCIMDALRRASEVSAPIFFDTPGRSLDDDHKKAQLKYFWSLQKHQFVIFPHTGEYMIEETLQEYGGLIGAAWELTWAADLKECMSCGTGDPLKTGSKMRCIPCGYEWDISSKQTTVRVLEV